MTKTARDLTAVLACAVLAACSVDASTSAEEHAPLDRPIRRPNDVRATGSPAESPSPARSTEPTGAIGASVPLPGCAACRVHVPPSYANGVKRPAPLLVAFHGDEGPMAGVPNVLSLWSAAADAHGYIVLAVACGDEIGCQNGNFSEWLAAQGYSIDAKKISVLEDLTSSVESLYDVDPKREYLAGYSGGAYVLGYFAQSQASRYAAVAFVAGGMPAWTGTGHACPARKIAGYFLGGDRDPRTAGQMSDTAAAFQDCGQQFALDLVHDADHAATIAAIGTDRGEAIAKWFDAHSLP